MDYWKSSTIKLRPIQAGDIELFDQFDDEEDKFVDVIHFPQTTQTRQTWIEKELQKQRTGDAFRWIAEDRNGIPVGTIDTFDCNRRHGTFKYGIAVGKPYRGSGYAKEMILLVLRYYFMELGYQKVTPHVFSFNERSLKLHESLGFIREGRLRSMVYCNGAYHDEIYFGMTRREFELKYPDFLYKA